MHKTWGGPGKINVSWIKHGNKETIWSGTMQQTTASRDKIVTRMKQAQ